MHELEMTAQPIVTPLILGSQVQLSEPNVRTLAYWLTKTTAMLSLAHRGPIVPASHFRELYAKHSAPSQCVVSIGLSNTWRQEITDIHHPLTLSVLPGLRPSNAYGISIRVGRFIAHVLGHTLLNATLRPETSLPDVMTEIWPSVRPISWPPAATIADRDVDLVVQMFPHV